MCKRISRFFATGVDIMPMHIAEIVLHYFDDRDLRVSLIPTPRIILPTRLPMPAGAHCSRIAAYFFTLLCAIAGICHTFAGEGPSADQTFEPRPSDQIWLVNTRCVACVEDNSGWSTSRYDAGYWKGSDDKTFYASDDQETVT